MFGEGRAADTDQPGAELTVPPAGTVDDGGRNHYSMVLEWEPEGGVYVVTVPELPGCRTHGTTYEEAAKHGQEVIEPWLDSARRAGEDVPLPRHFDLDSIDMDGVVHFTLTGEDDDDALPYEERIVEQMIARVEEARRAQP